MGDDAQSIEALQAELRQMRERWEAERAESASLRSGLAASRAQQTATAEVLRVIAAPPRTRSASR